MSRVPQMYLIAHAHAQDTQQKCNVAGVGCDAQERLRAFRLQHTLRVHKEFHLRKHLHTATPKLCSCCLTAGRIFFA